MVVDECSMSRLRWPLGGLIFAFILNGTFAYQFDTDNLILYEDATVTGEGSYFGYSLDIWNNPDSKTARPSIIVGAPRGNSSFDETVFQPGTVFRCVIGEKCEEWKLTPVSNNSWLGGALAVENSEILQTVVCAPRWSDGNLVSGLEPMRGMCFRVNTDNFSNPSPKAVHPLSALPSSIVKERANHTYAHFGASGFSIHSIPRNGGFKLIRYALGSPGVYYQAGTIVICRNDSEFIISDVVNFRQALSAGYESYGGYAVTSGRYTKAENIYVIGAPRGGNLTGGLVNMVLRSSKSGALEARRYMKNITYGEQFGEYFGAALATCNIHKNDTAELLVGAPHWSKPGSQEEGRIYVMKHVTDGQNYVFAVNYRIDGKVPKARYGSTITCLGDLDNDGLGDVAVGAPYQGNGVVFIYHGSENGRLVLTQEIRAPSVTRGFGISISRAMDIDNNGYADFAVGAYRSGHVTLIRSKRVVTTKLILKTNVEGEPLTIKRDATSFNIEACSSFSGKDPPKNLEVTRHFIIDEKYRRAYFFGKSGLRYEFNDTVLMVNESAFCQTYDVHINKTIVGFIEPLVVSVTQRLSPSNETGTSIIRKDGTKIGEEHFSTDFAVAYKAQPEVWEKIQIFFALDCNSGARCTSDLSIHMNLDDSRNVTDYVIGSESVIKLNITVNNTADPAYYTWSFLRVPNFIKLANGPSECRSYEIANFTEIKCFLGNPLEKNMPSTINYHLDMSRVPSNTTKINLEAVVTTRSNTTAGRDGIRSLIQIDCVTETDIGIMGETDLDLHRFNLTREEDQSPSVQVRHSYEIKSHERTPITEAVLSVTFPTEWTHGDKKIQIVRVNDTITDLAGEKFGCVTRERIRDQLSPETDAYTSTDWLIGNDKSKFEVLDGKVFGASLDNVTLFLNCTNPAITCETLDCKLGGPLNDTHPTASLVLVFDVLLQNFTPSDEDGRNPISWDQSKLVPHRLTRLDRFPPHIKTSSGKVLLIDEIVLFVGKAERMRGKNVIFFVSNGSTRTTEESGITQTVNKRPDSILIGTRLIGKPSEYQEPPSIWILAVSVSVGLLLLMFMMVGLYKLGFFNRATKKKMQLLKEEYAIKSSSPSFFILQTTSAET